MQAQEPRVAKPVALPTAKPDKAPDAGAPANGLRLPAAHQPGDGAVPLPAVAANYTPLTPLSFLTRTAEVYPDQVALIHGDRRLHWREVMQRCTSAAAQLHALGIVPGDVVAIMAPNIPALFEAHFFVPMTGAILNAINTRLEAATVRHILEHGGARVLFVDRDSTSVVREALEGVDNAPLLVTIEDDAATGEPVSGYSYEAFVMGSSATSTADVTPATDQRVTVETVMPAELPQREADWQWQLPSDEWQSISLNYTSGTTGLPKGVVYHHRGAALNALSNITGWQMGMHPVYLWTLPMFHCNGWCFPWSLAATAGTSICTRAITAEVIYDSIEQHGVTHFCGAPIILNFIVNADPGVQRTLPHQVAIMTAAAPPPAAILQKVEALGFHVTHVYGLTETYGPAVQCAWKPEWDALPATERARLKSRQGVRYQVLDGLEVMHADTLQPVPRDGTTIGEVMFRGNIVMRGYYRDQEANDQAFAGGWFHSGDLAVMDSDGYLRIMDRAKDIIISGGENISSIEIENTLFQHPDVLEAAVAARPDEQWGETPCAFVELRTGSSLRDVELIDWCRERLAHFKCPKTIIFRELPKTSTGKIQKFQLREWARALAP